jgi:hypothetical protein
MCESQLDSRESNTIYDLETLFVEESLLCRMRSRAVCGALMKT